MEKSQTILKKLKLEKHGRFLGFGTSPQADWKLIFLSALVLTLGVITLSVYIFIKINRGEIFMVTRPESAEGISLDISLLEDTVVYYREKAAEFQRLRAAPSSAVDPSL